MVAWIADDRKSLESTEVFKVCLQWSGSESVLLVPLWNIGPSQEIATGFGPKRSTLQSRKKDGFLSVPFTLLVGTLTKLFVLHTATRHRCAFYMQVSVEFSLRSGFIWT